MPSNPYVPGTVPGTDPRTARLIQQLYQRTNQLSDEIEKLRDAMPPSGATKESPSPGIIVIPSVNGDGFIRVSKDGVIVSYTNPITTPMIPTGVLYTNTNDDASISNTAVETSVFSVLDPSPGSSRTIIDTVGSIYRVRSTGNIGSTVATNLNINFKIGNVVIGNNGNPVMTLVPVGRYYLDFDFIVNRGGPTGQVVGFIFFQYGNVAGGITTLVTHTNGTLIPVDFSDPIFDFTVQWSVANPAHFFQPFTLTVEKMR